MRNKHVCRDNGLKSGQVQVKQMEQLILRTQGVKILVVDDSQPNLLIAKNVLERSGVVVTTALSGSEAVELVKEKDFDLIVLDCMMPEMSGHDTALAIRALPAAKAKIPIVAYTANRADEALSDMADVGVTDVLEKPLDIVELSKILLHYLAPGKMIDEQEIKRLLSVSGDLKQDTTETCSELRKALLPVAGLDYDAGLRYVGGDDGSYLNVLKATCKAMEEAGERLEQYYSYMTQKAIFSSIDDNMIRDYGCNGVRIDTHSMKGICAGIGLGEFSKDSAVMERMATDGDEVALLGDLKPYIFQLRYYHNALSEAIAPLLQEAAQDDEGVIPMEVAAYTALWAETEESINVFDIDAIQEGLHRLFSATEAGEKREALKKAIEASEMFDYTTVAQIMEQYR